jgi:hypothetical protein
LDLKSLAGHPCLFICNTVVARQTIVFVIGIFADDNFVTGNSVGEITAVRGRMNERFILTDQGNRK